MERGGAGRQRATGELILAGDASPDISWASPLPSPCLQRRGYLTSTSSPPVSPLGCPCLPSQAECWGCRVTVCSETHTESMQGREWADGGWFFGQSTSGAVGLQVWVSHSPRLSTRSSKSSREVGNSFVISRYTPQWHSPAQPELSLFLFFFSKPRHFCSSLSQPFPRDRPCHPQTLGEPGSRSPGEQASPGVSELPDLQRSKGRVNCGSDGCDLSPVANFTL